VEWSQVKTKISASTIVGILILFAISLGRPSLAESISDSASIGVQTTAGVPTWYIRGDGGDRKQCNGQADKAYTGGSGKPCAFKHPYYLFTDDVYGNKKWVISGGDTVIIRGGPYRMGYKGPNAKDIWGSCPGDAYGCFMPPVPSGTAARPTRLLGENYESCSKKTQLFGGYALASIVDLSGSTHVDLQCIELTDHGQCSKMGGGLAGSNGCNTSFPLSDFAAVGITTNASTANVLLKDLDIHGLTTRGIIGPIGGEITVDHVRIAFNGGAGWDFDDGKGTKSSTTASVRASYLTVEWNGCNEEYPITHATPALSCFDQDHSGYGDGIGTPDTPLNFACDHCLFRYNTQDGFDLLHTSGSLISVTNSASYGNMGQQWKMGPMRSVLFQNNITVNNCRRMSAPFPGAPDGYNKFATLQCRASGIGILFQITDGGHYVLQNNSFAGYGSTSYGVECSGSCGTAKVLFQNNLNVGYNDSTTGQPAAIYYAQEVPRSVTIAKDHNIYFNMRSCPSGPNERCIDPKLVNLPKWSGEASLDAIDFHLTSGSPARGSGAPVQGLATDHDGTPRPAGTVTDIGAFQFRP
jgi:hypothetical protein